MEMSKRYTARSDLLAVINRHYAIRAERIRLYRTGGGRVFYIQCPAGRKVLKLYRPMHTDCAIQTTEIIPYLADCGFPIVQIIPTVSHERYMVAERPEGSCVGVLFEYANGVDTPLHKWREGTQPVIHPLTRQFCRQVGLMHRLMDSYRGSLIPKGRERYIGDMIGLMRRDGYDEARTRDLEEYGNELWARLEKLPRGFCHGDMHAGNTKYRGGSFTWMDFDRATLSYPIVDLGWLTDASNFNVFDAGALDRSRRLFDEVYAGYSRERTLTAGEVAAVFDCVAIIHYDLISSIVIMNNETLDREFIGEQHGWLMNWRELCEKMMR